MADFIHTCAGVIQELTPDGVQLQDGKHIKADLLVQALGWDKPHGYFSPAVYKSLDFGEDGVHLYRNIVAPTIPVRAHMQEQCTSSFVPVPVMMSLHNLNTL